MGGFLKIALDIYANSLSQYLSPMEKKKLTNKKLPSISREDYIQRFIDGVDKGFLISGDITFLYQNFQKGNVSESDVRFVQEYVKENAPGRYELRVMVREKTPELVELIREAVDGGGFKRVVVRFDGDLGVDGVEYV